MALRNKQQSCNIETITTTTTPKKGNYKSPT